jgi:hypothetical protein
MKEVCSVDMQQQHTSEHRSPSEAARATDHVRGLISRLLGKKHHSAGKTAALAGRTSPTVPAVEIGIAHALWNLVVKIIRESSGGMAEARGFRRKLAGTKR